MAASTRSKTAEREQQAEGHAQEQAHMPAIAGPHGGILGLQRAAGNRAVSQLVQPGAVSVPPDQGVRRIIEEQFGTDLSDVRVHTGPDADDRTRVEGAAAYASGRDVHMRRGLDPTSDLGWHVLAHELTHIVQQERGAAGRPLASDASLEREASAVSGVGAARGPIEAGAAALGSIQKITEAELQQEWRRLHPPKAGAFKTANPFDIEGSPAERAVYKTWRDERLQQLGAESAAKVRPGMGAAATSASPLEMMAEELLYSKSMEGLGTAKGVGLEVANLVDVVLWLPHVGQELAETGITTALARGRSMGLSLPSDKEALDIYNTYLSSYKPIQKLAKEYGFVDEMTGAPSIAGKVGQGYDAIKQLVEQEAFANVPKEDPLFFTAYELGELEGAVGLQIFLTFFGVAEVQLALKVVGAVGAVKSIVDPVQRDPSGWHKNPDFWAGILNTVLSILGLRQTSASSKIVKIILAAGPLLNVAPAVWKLYNDYNNSKLAQNSEERHQILVRDWGNLIKILKDVILQALHKGSLKGKGAPPAREGEVLPPEAPLATKTPSRSSGTRASEQTIDLARNAQDSWERRSGAPEVESSSLAKRQLRPAVRDKFLPRIPASKPQRPPVPSRPQLPSGLVPPESQPSNVIHSPAWPRSIRPSPPLSMMPPEEIPSNVVPRPAAPAPPTPARALEAGTSPVAVGTKPTASQSPTHGHMQNQEPIQMVSQGKNGSADAAKQPVPAATTGDPVLDAEIHTVFDRLEESGKARNEPGAKFDPAKDPYAKPGVRIPVSKEGAPAPVMDVGAGSRPADLGLPSDASLVQVIRSDITGAPHIDTVFDARGAPPRELWGTRGTLFINNPRGYTPNISELGKALTPGGRIIIQGRGRVGEPSPKNVRGFNPDFQRLIDEPAPPGFRKIVDVEEGALPAAKKNSSRDILGGPFYRTEGDQQVWPNARVIFERLPKIESDLTKSPNAAFPATKAEPTKASAPLSGEKVEPLAKIEAEGAKPVEPPTAAVPPLRPKILWGTWNDYPKEIVNGRVYARVGDRLYTEHAVERMQPSGQRYSTSVKSPPGPSGESTGGYPGIQQIRSPKKIRGRSVAPQFVEDVIASTLPIDQHDGTFSHTSGSLQVILDSKGRVITIITIGE